MARIDVTHTGNGLLMLGLIHRDSEGEQLLSGWLRRTAPGAITLEFSRYGYDFRVQNGDAFRARVHRVVDELVADGRPVNDRALAALLSYIDLPFEFVVTSDYATRHDVPLFLIDMDRYSSSNLSEIDGLLEKENLETMLACEPCSDGRYQRTMARLFFDKGVCPFPYTDEMRVRDACMRDRIAALLHRPRRTGPLVHVCGWQHLCDPLHLYRELDPAKVFIYDKTLRI